MAVITHPFERIVLYPVILIFFGMNEELLFALLVLETDLVKSLHAFAFARASFDAALGLFFRQFVGRHLAGVVDAADADRLVGIAFEKINDYLVPNTRKKYCTPSFTCPVLRYAYPARAIFVPFSIPVPVELYFQPPVFVGKDLLTFRTHHDRRLSSLDDRFRSQSLRPKGHCQRYAGKAIAVMEI